MKSEAKNIMWRKKNIISNSKILISHFTGKEKIITLRLIILMLSFVNITLCFSNNFVSALSYESEVGIGFTFNPTLSVSLSSSDLIISNLTPGTASDSNSINVSVATNSAYGYILTTSVGNSTIYNSTNLIHNKSNNIFSSIPTSASLSSLENSSDNNIWGYSYKLSSSNTWSNYSGLPLYNSPLKVLLNTDSNDETNNAIDFKIAAKASSTQASGEYNNVVNFSAVTKPTPTTLTEAYANYYSATNKTMHNGYYVMQDMADSHICENTEVIGSELQVIDIRDDKVYWVAKLADGKCWMTQNLDLDITAGTTNINSNNTDLSINENVYTDNNTIYALKGENDAYGYTYENDIATWIPESSTIKYDQLNNMSWQDSYIEPYSYDRLDISNGGPIYPDDNVTQIVAGNHGLSGNYYNWSATVASNDASRFRNDYDNVAANSICPKGWRLPDMLDQEFGNLLVVYNIIKTVSSNSYIENVSSVNSMGVAPLYFIRGGTIGSGLFYNSGSYGYYWSNASVHMNYAALMYFGLSKIFPLGDASKYYGRSVRCLAR